MTDNDREDYVHGAAQILYPGQTIEFHLKEGEKHPTTLVVLKHLNVDETIKNSHSTVHDVSYMRGKNLTNWIKYLVDNGYVEFSPDGWE